jgi:hypothetical protein
MGIHRKIPVEEWPAIAIKYKDGESLGKIGRDCGCSSTHIRKILLSQGVELRRQPFSAKPVNPTLEEIVQRAARERENRKLLMQYGKLQLKDIP